MHGLWLTVTVVYIIHNTQEIPECTSIEALGCRCSCSVDYGKGSDQVAEQWIVDIR